MAHRRTRSRRGGAPPSPPPVVPNWRQNLARQRAAAQAGRREAGYAAASVDVATTLIDKLSSQAGRVELGDREALEAAMVANDMNHFFGGLKGLAVSAKNDCDDDALVIADDHVFLLDDARDQLRALFGDGALEDPATRAELREVVGVCAAVLLGGGGKSVDNFCPRGEGFFRAFNVKHVWQPVVSMAVAVVAFVLREILDGRVDDLAGKQLAFLAASCHGLLPTVVGSSALAEAVAALRSEGELPEEGPVTPVDTASLKELLAAALCVPTPEAAEKARTEKIRYATARVMALELVVDVLGRPDTYSVEVLEGLVKAVADGERPNHALLDLLEARVTVVEPLYALKALQSIDGADAQKLAEAKRKLTTLDADWVVVALSPKEPGVWAAPALDFGNNVPLLSELEELVRGATIVDGAAVLRGVNAIVALMIGGGGKYASQLRDEGHLNDTISGDVLFLSLGVTSRDRRYAAAFGCFAGAGALRSCLDSAFDAGAVRLALAALSLSGQSGAIMPSVAEAHAFDDVRAAALALDPSGSFGKVQIEVIADAFNVTTPDQRALDAFEARRGSAGLEIGLAALDVVAGRSGFAGAEDLLRDLEMRERGTVYSTLLRAAQSADTAVMKLPVDPDVIPILDPLIDKVRRALGDMGEEDRTSCVEMAKALLIQGGGVEFFRGSASKFREVALLGTTAACSAVLLVADGADRALVAAALASICGFHEYNEAMLMPSAFKSKEVGEAKVWLELCGMFPKKGASLRRPRMLLEALLDGKSRGDLTDMFDEMVREESENALREADIFASADAADVRAEIGESSASDDEPHEGDTFGEKPWWRKKAEAMRVAARRMVAGSKVLSPEHADPDYYKSIRDMAETPFTPSPPSTPDWLLNAESVERAFEAAGRENLRKPAGPKRGAEHNKGVSPAKPPPAPKNRDA